MAVAGIGHGRRPGARRRRLARAHRRDARRAARWRDHESGGRSVPAVAAREASALMLVADALVCARKGRAILAKVSFSLAPGEVLGVLGANGAGKSTLLATLAGELPPGAGALRLDRRPLHRGRGASVARRPDRLPRAPRLAFAGAVSGLVATGA